MTDKPKIRKTTYIMLRGKFEGGVLYLGFMEGTL